MATIVRICSRNEIDILEMMKISMQKKKQNSKQPKICSTYCFLFLFFSFSSSLLLSFFRWFGNIFVQPHDKLYFRVPLFHFSPTIWICALSLHFYFSPPSIENTFDAAAESAATAVALSKAILLLIWWWITTNAEKCTKEKERNEWQKKTCALHSLEMNEKMQWREKHDTKHTAETSNEKCQANWEQKTENNSEICRKKITRFDSITIGFLS